MDKKVCPVCLADFARPRNLSATQWYTRTYCSARCQAIAYSKKSSLARPPASLKQCAACGNDFPRPKDFSSRQWDERRYCSLLCAHTAAARSVEKHCKGCGCVFIARPCEEHYIYCSFSCHQRHIKKPEIVAEKKRAILLKVRKWQKENPEKCRMYQATPEARARARQKARLWRLANPEHMKLLSSAYRARKFATSPSFNAEEYLKLTQRQRKCHICRKPFTLKNPATLDHIIALSNGGRHVASNIALAHRSCNSSKNARRTHLL